MDPLRPFAGLIRTLWRSQSGAASSADSPLKDAAAGEIVTERGGEARLTERLRTQLLRIGIADPRRARDAFIETVLVAELGEGLVRDPAFSAVVARVSEQLGADPALAAQLQSLLEWLVAAP